MVARYEQLRGDELDPSSRRALLPGRALFLRQGMAGWMRAWSTCLDKPDVRPNSTPVANAPLPEGLRAQLAIILAGMILGQQQRCTP